MVWLAISVLFLLFGAVIYIFARLFSYIKKLEDKITEFADKTDNMHQSLGELVQEDFLLSDGRLKKMLYQREDKNNIYNGIKVNDSEISF